MLRVIACLPGLALFMVAGCTSPPPGLVPVSGVVTLDGKEMPASGTVWFVPVETPAGFVPRPGTGEFGIDGRYRAKTWKPGDGLTPGRYKVYVTCWQAPPKVGIDAGSSFIPEKYTSEETSGLELTIEPGAAATTFDVFLASE